MNRHTARIGTKVSRQRGDQRGILSISSVERTGQDGKAGTELASRCPWLHLCGLCASGARFVCAIIPSGLLVLVFWRERQRRICVRTQHVLVACWQCGALGGACSWRSSTPLSFLWNLAHSSQGLGTCRAGYVCLTLACERCRVFRLFALLNFPHHHLAELQAIFSPPCLQGFTRGRWRAVERHP